jgi:hypothetical protein
MLSVIFIKEQGVPEVVLDWQNGFIHALLGGLVRFNLLYFNNNMFWNGQFLFERQFAPSEVIDTRPLLAWVDAIFWVSFILINNRSIWLIIISKVLIEASILLLTLLCLVGIALASVSWHLQWEVYHQAPLSWSMPTLCHHQVWISLLIIATTMSCPLPLSWVSYQEKWLGNGSISR